MTATIVIICRKCGLVEDVVSYDESHDVAKLYFEYKGWDTVSMKCPDCRKKFQIRPRKFLAARV